MDEYDAEKWWSTLSPRRKAQIHAWVAGGKDREEIPGQMELIDMEDEN